ncbi:hypothetical protein Rhe02_63760 [Rhizocola hellebori]|uniref:DUF2690 domain-containing protein n=1 Tax=Rhizocola hellebori TaxID=1392758 RepID=A0A8J3QCN4_9ACTN|nr:hypothetical protein Rhe02_63760 [Rhizocola hellebori]
MRWRVKLGITLSLLATVFATTIVAPTPALAGTCLYTACNGSDPHGTGCDQPEDQIWTLHTIWPEIAGALELRYSPSCGAAWARYTNTFGVPGRVEIYGCGEGFCLVKWRKLVETPDRVVWSPMLSYTYRVQACVLSNGNRYCTAQF